MTASRELAHRHQDGLQVTLLWDARSNEVSIALLDDRSEAAFAFVVDPASALDAFHHPYAYAPGADLEAAAELAGLSHDG
jgi:YD repeat-containing protein